MTTRADTDGALAGAIASALAGAGWYLCYKIAAGMWLVGYVHGITPQSRGGQPEGRIA